MYLLKILVSLSYFYLVTGLIFSLAIGEAILTKEKDVISFLGLFL